MLLRFISFLFVLTAVDAYAAKLNKCVGGDGHVTFTQGACAGGLTGEVISVQSGGAGMLLGPVGTSSMADQSSEESVSKGQVTVVGVESSGCNGGSEQEIRSAVVRNQVYPGMSAKQVVQSWGEPSKINRSSSGSDQWVYYRGGVEMQFVYVDQKGCVTDWN